MVDKKILLIIRKPPRQVADAWDALRLALSLYAAQANFGVVFEGAGVSNLFSKEEAVQADPYSTLKLIRDLDEFGVKMFAVKEDAEAAGFQGSPPFHSQLVNRQAFAGFVTGHDVVLAF